MITFPRSIAVLLLALASTPALAEPRDDVRSSIESLASMLTDGEAAFDPVSYAPVRAVDSPYLAVFFTLQHPGGGNGSWEYLAFFAERPEPLAAAAPAARFRLVAFQRIGARGERQFRSSTAILKGNTLTVSGAVFAPNDAMCCPSVPITASFELSNGVLYEMHIGR